MNEQSHSSSLSELAELLTRASRRLRNNERKALAPYGLTFAQARALRLLAAAGPMCNGDLAAALEIVPRSATSRVDDLERAGLVTRSADPQDRRSVIIAATLQGQELVTRLRSERQMGAEGLFAPLSAQDQADLLRILGALTSALADSCGRAGRVGGGGDGGAPGTAGIAADSNGEK